jgi:hypothetical protein
MAAKGHAKMTRKLDQMRASWEAAKPRAISNYRAVGFGPTRTRNFEAGLTPATIRFDPDKWRRNWEAKMAE